MKTYKHARFTLLAGILLAGVATNRIADAEPQLRLLVNHHTLKQPAGIEQGQMLVEIINPGPEVLNNTIISLEDASRLQTFPAQLPLGKLEPAKVKAATIAFQRSSTSDAANTDKTLVWHVEYLDAQGVPHQLSILSASQDASLPVTE